MTVTANRVDDWLNLAGWRRPVGTIPVSSATQLVGLQVGTDGQVLTADSGSVCGMSWQTPAATGVTSFNGFTGAIDTTTTFVASGIEIRGGGVGKLIVAADGSVALDAAVGKTATLSGAGGDTTVVCGTGSVITITGNNGINHFGHIGTDQTQAATIPGAVLAKWPIYDNSGTLIGYLPLYDNIT